MPTPRAPSPQPSDATQVDSTASADPAPSTEATKATGQIDDGRRESGDRAAGDNIEKGGSPGQSEWDEDGVRIVDGVPLLGLTGSDDPRSCVVDSRMADGS